MTPERAKWWNSLPTEEKRIRTSIKWHKQIVAYVKALFEDEITCDIDYEKKVMREAKRAIKALRKEIAQRPVIRTQPPTASPYKCPRCGASLMYLLRCVKCGQKLRWK